MGWWAAGGWGGGGKYFLYSPQGMRERDRKTERGCERPIELNCVLQKNVLKIYSLLRAAVTFVENRVFTDRVKLRRGHAGSGWALSPITSIFIKERRKMGCLGVSLG